MELLVTSSRDWRVLPCIIFEDDHLLVVNKPAGLNTHAPSPYAGQGLYEWLRDRERRWASLAIIHRLDKETSGVMLFSKTPQANRSLTDQFTRRHIRKTYLLLTDRPGPRRELRVKSSLARAGDKYVSRPASAGGEVAETIFRAASRDLSQGATPPGLVANALEAQPLTGRTHQIRVHAAENGFPILGDTLYGGTPAQRVYLHAAEIHLRHPTSGADLCFRASADFCADARQQLRALLLDPAETNACRLIHGAADGWPGWHVDRLGNYLLSESESALDERQTARLQELLHSSPNSRCAGACHKNLSRQVRRAGREESSPRPVLGRPPPERFTIRENNLQFELSFAEGYSVGLFLDQRENRRRLLTGTVAPGFELNTASRGCTVLNTFAYTCGFSVCAARSGASVTSVDLSKKYLEWGRRNFTLNGLDPAAHQFLFGDVFDWLRRLAKKGRLYDLVLLDPPTFSQSKESGIFRAEKDYGALVSAALPLVRPSGVLFASTNAAGWPPQDFLAAVEGAVNASGRKIKQSHYVPQPFDFPITRAEPAYLKTVWLRVAGAA